jgi:hypothetical protein
MDTTHSTFPKLFAQGNNNKQLEKQCCGAGTRNEPHNPELELHHWRKKNNGALQHCLYLVYNI